MTNFKVKVANMMSEGPNGRQINVFNASKSDETFIGYQGSAEFTIPCEDVDSKLRIGVTQGPGDLKRWCWIYIPQNENVTFGLVPPGSGNRLVTTSISTKRTIFAIPPGYPDWHLELKCEGIKLPDCKITLSSELRNVTPGDDGPGDGVKPVG